MASRKLSHIFSKPAEYGKKLAEGSISDASSLSLSALVIFQVSGAQSD